MMQCPELINKLEKLAPREAAAAWDNSGIQVIGSKKEIKRLAVALDPSVATIDKAIDFGADFIFCHHPLLLEPIFLNEDNDYSRIVRKLMQTGTYLYSAHTSIDGQPNGPVRWLAKALELSDLKMLEPACEGSSFGFGFCGLLPRTYQLNEFIKELSRHLSTSHFNICGKKPEQVLKVACCPGSGSSMWPAAKALGADIFITGDVKYHTALSTELCILDVGHFALEEEMMRQFTLLLEKELAGVEVKFFEAQDPIQPYII